MLRDQGLFSQVISWDSRYTDFYSQRGAQEEWCTARSRLQSHSKEFGPLETRRDFFFFQETRFQNKTRGKRDRWHDRGGFSFPSWARRWNNAATSYLFSHPSQNLSSQFNDDYPGALPNGWQAASAAWR